MNDNDLERDLRAQRSPRQEGYTPMRLPMTLEEAPFARRGPSRLPQIAMLVGAGVAGALAVAIAAGAFSGGPGPGVGATGSTSPSAVASASGTGECAPADVSFTAEPWGGAAGSRGTVVTVTLAAGHDACTVGAAPAAQIADANGNVLVTTKGGGSNGSVTLESGSSFTIGIAWSNWCGSPPALPVELSLHGGSAPVVVPVPDGGLDPVPECMGSNVPSSLSATDLQPQP
jgi:hypothetical protein